MIFTPFYRFDTGCAAYLLGCGGSGQCAVVDPHERSVDVYLTFAASKGLRITHVIDTHVHADHHSGGPELAMRAEAAYCLHESANVDLEFEPLCDGQVLTLGNLHISVLHTPGHTPESISLLVTDLRRGEDPWFVLTGDTLLVGAVGRPDLGRRAREHARELHDSIHERLLTLPDELEVYPAHFSGSVCGVGLSGKPSSTIGFEKRWNPLLSRSRDEFVEALTSPPPPAAAVERLAGTP
jgi:hydroxyacylglutathione hydrolase